MQSPSFDGAVLKVALAGEFWVPVAAARAERGVSFVFLTGYGEPALMPPLDQAAPRTSEPFDIDRWAQLLAGRFRTRSSDTAP